MLILGIAIGLLISVPIWIVCIYVYRWDGSTDYQRAMGRVYKGSIPIPLDHPWNAIETVDLPDNGCCYWPFPIDGEQCINCPDQAGENDGTEKRIPKQRDNPDA